MKYTCRHNYLSNSCSKSNFLLTLIPVLSHKPSGQVSYLLLARQKDRKIENQATFTIYYG